MSCVFRTFNRILEVMLFARKMKNSTVFTLILGGLNVAISLVLGMFLNFMCFHRCVFYRFLWTFQWKKHVHRLSPGAQNSGNTDNSCFLCFLIVRNFKENWENHEIQKSIWRYYINENGDFHVINKVRTWKSRWSPGAQNSGNSNENGDFRGRPKGAHRGHPEVLNFYRPLRT